MKKFKTKNLLIAALSLLCAVMLSFSVAFFGVVNGKKARASAPVTGTDVIIGDLTINADGSPDSNGKVFNGEKLAELYDAILGTSYSKKGTLNNVKNLLNSKGTIKLGSGVTTKALNAADFRKFGGKDIYVTFGGIEWAVVYLTTNRAGDIIVDLYQATSTLTSSFSYGAGYTDFRNNSTLTNLSNLYATSYIRSVVLGNGGVYYQYNGMNQASDGIALNPTGSDLNASAYKEFVNGNFSSYIDAPISLEYQEKQSWVELNGLQGANYSKAFCLPSDVYGTPSVENYFLGNVTGAPNDRATNTNYSHNDFTGVNASGQAVNVVSNYKANYEDWQNDKVWLPSMTETGCASTDYPSVDGVWELTANQRINNVSLPSWLRSGSYTDSSHVYYTASNMNCNSSNTAYGVRPALHLNLTKAEADSIITVPVPQNISEDYDGNGKWLDTLATLTNTSGSYKYPWIDTSLHNDPTKVTVSKIEYTSVDALGANIQTTNVTSSGTANIVNAGKYDITLNIPSGQTDYVWRDGSTGDKKFTITVNPKAVPYTLQIMKGGSSVTSLNYGDTYTASLKQTAVTNLPTGLYELWYQGTGTTVYTASKTAPTNAGTYSVSLKAVPDTANAGKNLPSNYKFSGSAVNFTITPKQVTIPTVTGAQEYTGSPITYVLSDFNGGADIRVDSVTGANGNTATGANGAAITDTTDTFEATKVDTYTVTLGLRDTVNYAWSDGTNSDKQITFEVTQKELLSSAPVSSKVNGIGGAEWSYGESGVTVTITDDRISGENINLLFYYDNKSNTLTGVTTGNVTVITMPANIAVGTHTLTVELNGTTGDNANYKLTKNDTLSFEITSGKIDPTTYGWTYTKDGAAGSTIVNGGKIPFALKTGSATDGVKYELSIQIPASDSFVVVDTSKYVNGYQTRSKDAVGKYTTTVALKSTDPTFMFEVNGVKSATIDVTFSWEIEKGTFDLSGVIWEYSTDGNAWKDYDPTNPPQYNDGYDVTVRIKSSSLPLGLSLDSFYSGVSEDSVNSYVANVSASDLVYNTLNFNAPDTSILTLNWEIAKKNLYTGFKNEKESYTNTAGNSGSFIIKKLNLDPAFELYIEYKYYEISTGAPVTLADIKSAADPTQEKQYKVEAYIDPAYAANYCVEMPDGTTPSDTFVTGSKNKLATATLDGNDGATPITVTYDGKGHFDASLVKVTGDDGMNVTDFTVTYYKGSTPTAGNELAAGETPKDAGEYCIVITLGSIAEKKYILGTDTFKLVIEAKGIELPALGGITFNGAEQNFEDFLGGSWNDYKDIIELGGAITERNVGSGEYVTTLKLKDTNDQWIYPS